MRHCAKIRTPINSPNWPCPSSTFTSEEPYVPLHIRGVPRHAYGKRQVLRGVTFDVPDGTLVGVVGENGAGKTTLLRILSGELTPTAGTAHRTGRLGYCPQQVVVNEAFTVAQHLRFFQVAYGLPDLRYAEELMEELHCAPRRPRQRAERRHTAETQPHHRADARPELLLLDEPYQGLDWDTYLRFWGLGATAARPWPLGPGDLHLAHDANRLDTLHRLESGVLRRIPLSPEGDR